MRAARLLIPLYCFLVACGGPAATPTINAVATQTRQAEVAQVATLTAPTATIAVTSTPIPPTSTPPYSGSRWHGIPKPGDVTVVQEETDRLTLYLAGTAEDAAKLYTRALEQDGYIRTSHSLDATIEAFVYQKGQQVIAFAVGPDTGNQRAVVVIEDRSSAAAHVTPTATRAPVCSTSDGKKVYDLLKQFSQEWDDALKLADSTPRISLSPQIAKLQEIRRKVQSQQWPTCAQSAYSALIKAMDGYINGYIDFLGQGFSYTTIIAKANDDYKTFLAELGRITR